MSIIKRGPKIMSPGEQRAITAAKALVAQNDNLRKMTKNLMDENDRLKWVAKWRFVAMTIEAAMLIAAAILTVMK